MVGSRRGVARGAAQVVHLGGWRVISESSTIQPVSYIIRNRIERTFHCMLNCKDMIRIERVIEGTNWQHFKTRFLKTAPHQTILVLYGSGCKYDSNEQRTTIIHVETIEIWKPQVTPQNHTRVQKSARVQGWLKTTIIACIQWLHADIPAVLSVGSMVEVCAWLSGSTKNPYIEFRSSKNLEASPVS